MAKKTEEDEGPPQIEPAKQFDWIQSQVRAKASPEELHNALERIRHAVQRNRELKFTNLWHHVYNVDQLREAYLDLKRQAAPGEDGQTWEQYIQCHLQVQHSHLSVFIGGSISSCLELSNDSD